MEKMNGKTHRLLYSLFLYCFHFSDILYLMELPFD